MQTSVTNPRNLLVATKFSPPRINARHIPRNRLLTHLREAQACTAAFITGGAGFGKTILLAQWRQELMRAGAEVAWLSLSHDDKQFPSFCSYLLAALQRLGIDSDGDMLQGDGGIQSMDAVVVLVASAAERIGKELYLLIDDFQHCEAPSSHRLMQKLLDHCPANLHFIIASRTAPSLSLGRLRMQGKVAEIEFAQLPFELEETRAFFEQNLSTLKLTADEVRLIHDLTNGWPASLQPIATMLRIRPAKRSKLRSLLWKSTDLQSYLAEDVVAYLPSELVDVMERISIFRRFNADLAEFVTENPNAAELIKRAEDENLLIYRVDSDDSSPWYRFHPLFGEFLAQRLSQQGQPVVEALHLRGSQWFAEHGFLVESIRHANLGGDLEYAATAMEQAASGTWSMAYISPMLHLLDRLPQETLFSHPRLFLLGCLTYAFTSRADTAERWLEQIRKTDAARTPAISSKFPLLDAAIAVQREDMQRVIDLLEPACKVPLENRSMRYASLAGLATAYLALGRYEDVARLYDNNPIDPENCENDMEMIFASVRAQMCLTQGNVREAERIGSRILALSEERFGRVSIPANICAAAACDAYYELDRIDDALEVLANRTATLRSSNPDVMGRASVCRARIDVLQDAPKAAFAFLEAQAAHFNILGVDRPMAYMFAEQVKILLAMGDHILAAQLVAKLNALGAVHRDATGFLAEIPALAALASARLALVDCNPSQALEALSIAHRFAEKYGRGRTMVSVNLLAAVAHDSMEQEEEASGCLVKALQTGARLGLVRTVLDEWEGVGDLLAGLKNSPRLDGPASRYLDELLARTTPADLPLEVVPAGRRNVDVQRATLTPREVEILGLTAQAMSNKRIALTLNITFGTVKWNVKNILAKLGVSSRYDAITVARQRGFLK
ncbi:LuxR C-terminal-related transcriptional regulator [Massilia cavernae]|uniref:ATP-dependent transcriptional regulator n=1 Tax=Massilia cavernae TaxID=2320864 RepID=A0A418X7I4_9BURK|nr:LuxR C-terminal-related transcriptional regulator [Massilia cavernae]RJG08368.1 ATP-dependent transcriptional regulator [Massilia cavernae]